MLFDGAAVTTAVDAVQDTQNALTNKAVPTADSEITSAAQTPTAADTPIAIDPNQIEAVTSLSGLTDSALALAQPAGDRNELIVVDGSLENLQSLLDNISRIAPDKTLLVLDPNSNQVNQLTAHLQEHSGQFDAIHILSHGGPGWISLNEHVLSLDALDQDAALWNSVKTGLTETGDLLLYGCSVAADENGQTQINALATLTGADIEIEYRDENEILSLNGQRISPLKSKGLNPAFDVTPAELISALVTEKGVYEISNGITPGSKLANA
jgi:hypothetical protein